jgi:formylglycine-generating enzyme required for sulfatase activity
MRLFISYSRDDKDTIYDLADNLHREGHHDVWIDRRLVGADEWWYTICTEIARCECFIFVITPKSVASIYCQQEYAYARACGKPILSLKLKPTQELPLEIAKTLSGRQFTDIEGLNADRKLLKTEQAIQNVRFKRLQGEYPPEPNPLPDPPSCPEPTPDHDQLMEEFTRAAIASGMKDWDLAKSIYTTIIRKDPDDLGKVAQKRITENDRIRMRERDYEQIKRLVANPVTLLDARALWERYVEKYGLNDPDHDPEGFQSDARFTTTAPPESHPPKPPTPTPKPVSSKPTPSAGETRTDAKGIVQVYVPPGIFNMGSNNYDREKPIHKVRITEGFWIDQFLVTNKSRDEFVKAGGYTEDRYWSAEGLAWRNSNPQNAKPDARYPNISSADDQPWIAVSYYEAEAYAAWRGGTLPTEAQWEYAARGPNALIYPWGNTFIAENVVYGGNSAGKTAPVGSKPGGKSWVGAYDMAGNALEWVRDYYSETYYQLLCGTNPTSDLVIDNPFNDNIADRRGLRGGSWYYTTDYVRSAYRSSNSPPDRNLNVGFRVSFPR